MLAPLPFLNPQQEEAIRYFTGPSLVIAGPGSGKTRVLTHKIAHLVTVGKVPPQKILAVTFTNKAADEMRGRVMLLLTEEKNINPANLWMGTFHSTCVKILRQDAPQIGIPANFAIYDDGDSRDLVKAILKEMPVLSERYSPSSLLGTISNAKNELMEAADYEHLAEGPFQEMVAHVFNRYQEELKKAQALDFDDLLNEVVRLFQKSPDVLKKWQEKFSYILVDEYQDTNRAQYELIKALSAKDKNLTVVGDMSQAIYSWRGADFRNILRFEKDYPQARVFRLEQNYRSTGKIITAAKNLIEHNRTHVPLKLWTQNPEGVAPVLYQAQNELDEAFYVTSQITALSEGKPQNLSDFAVLYRTNAQSRVLEEVFMRTGIPYTLVGGTKFYERKEVKDVLSYLRLVLNPADRVSLNRAEKIGKRRLGKFRNIAADLITHPPVKILDLILAETGYLEYLSDGTEEGQSRMDNVKELRSVATGFGSLPEFLEHVALVQPTDKLPRFGSKERGSVLLMTLHAAKGLEFPTVFITGLEEGLLPHSRSLESWEELEEERRLAYVGMTRAKRQLHLTTTAERLFFGARTVGIPSRFLSEIGEENLLFHLSQTQDNY
ncbi:MAG: UvrD-helicase domain-containing protein [Patescibacteria group bacterium]